MSIQDRNLKAGTKLIARYKSESHAAKVVKTADGLRYRLDDGREFKSPSSAGSAVMGGRACNGWKFWSIVDAASPKSKMSKAPTKQTKPQTDPTQ